MGLGTDVKKIAVCFPWTSPFMFTDFVDGNINMKKPDGVEMRWFRGVGWCPARRHINLCQQALEWGADLIVILGADQLHPEDTVCRLLDRFNEGYEVVAALVPCRGYLSWQEMKPFQPMAWRFKRQNSNGPCRAYRSMEQDGDMVEVVDQSMGEMVEADFVGSGVIMFHRDHLLALKMPWFSERFDPETMFRWASMDTTFAWRLKVEAGAQIWIDTTIKVKHAHVFRIDDTFQGRFDDWMNPGIGDKSICMIGAIPETTGGEHDDKSRTQNSCGNGATGSDRGVRTHDAQPVEGDTSSCCLTEAASGCCELDAISGT